MDSHDPLAPQGTPISSRHADVLAEVRSFNHQLLEAAARGVDVRPVVHHLDPDPARFFEVDEGGGRIPEMLAEGRRRLDEAPLIEGHVRHRVRRPLTGEAAAARPDVAAAEDGRLLLVWVSWERGRGEHVMAQLLDADRREVQPARMVSAGPSDCFRPRALFDAAGRPWVSYARSLGGVGGDVAVHACHLTEDAWSEEHVVSTTEHPSFNQEMVAHADGTVECVWQGRQGPRFGVFARRWRDGAWGPTERIDAGGDSSVWDPTATALPGGGAAYAWCGYRDGAYGVVVRRRPSEGDGVEQRLTRGSDYALHPSIAAAPDGSLWCAFDRMTIHGHGGSGPTALQPVERLDRPPPSQMRAPGEFVPPELQPNISAAVHLVRVTADGVEQDPVSLAEGLEINPAGMPQVVATHDAGVTVSYRILRRLPLAHYFWEVAVQQVGPEGPLPPGTLDDSDGGLEEPALAASRDGVVAVATTDDRRRHVLDWSDGFGGQRRSELIDHLGEIAWNGLHGVGQLVLAELEGPGPARRGEPTTTLVSSEREEARAWAGRNGSRYRTRIDGRVRQLYWGDLHRHSLISRCTAGDDPGIEDFYRFAWDVHDYDFWAVTDHAENSTEHQWWHVQKIADLFRVPGRFVPLYGFEWTSHLGHQNVIYGDVARGAPIFSATDVATDDPAKLWAALRSYPDHPAVTIPHHPGAAMVHYDWDFGDPEYLRLVEVFQSCRGNYEHDGGFRQFEDATLPGTFVVDGLRRGQRFGLIASSDHGYGASYVGVYADGLDRAEIFDALQARRTLAATARGIVVDARIGDTFMGGERRQDGPVELEAHVEGYRDLARVEVVRNGDTVHVVAPDPPRPEGWLAVPVRVEWGRTGQARRWDGSLEVRGGEILPTPFVGPEVREVEETRLRWEAATSSFGGGGLYQPTRGGVEATLLGPPSARVEVSTLAGGVTATLRDVQQGPVDADGSRAPKDSVLRMQPGVGGLTSLGTTATTLRWTDPVGGPAWYYVRVYLVDGEMAWSSPIWVDPLT